MEYIVCEQRPRHYSIQVSPLPGKMIIMPTPNEYYQQIGAAKQYDGYPVADMLHALQLIGIGGALGINQIVVLDGPDQDDWIIEYREQKHHLTQDWLRLVPIDQLGKRIYHGVD